MTTELFIIRLASIFSFFKRRSGQISSKTELFLFMKESLRYTITSMHDYDRENFAYSIILINTNKEASIKYTRVPIY